MNILELDSFKLSDAVKFHNRLNPKIWDRNEHLLPEVRSKLLEIAADFQEFLGLSDLDVQDITLSGSNAAYSYTPHSDIDLHLVVNVPNDEVYQELFNAKKYQYNDMHDIRIRGADVELYVQPADESPVSLGEYSIKNNEWIEVPKRKRARIDQSLVRHKYEDVKARIESALKENDSDRVESLIAKIKAMRQSGLDQHGEFGPENLAYKMLRSQGWIKRLYDHSAATRDRELSLKEQPKRPVKYGFGTDASDYRALFKPALSKAPAVNQDLQFNRPQDYEWFKQQQAQKKKLAAEDAGETWDGVNPTTCMVVNEGDDQEKIVHEFIRWAADKLAIDQMPEIFIHTDPEWSVKEHSFGRYEPDTHSLHVNMANRHLFDVLRTTAHELAHCKQNLVQQLPDDAGETGSEFENDAHAAAGIIMRDFADAHPELFNTKALEESASGYIPTKKQAKDPRYSMALTVDIKPGQVGKEANKMKLDTDAQGKPAMIYQSANQLHEALAAEFAAFSEAKSYGYGSTPLSQVPGEREDELGNQEATGPEFPPQMPAGTTKIDVSDLTDWYRLGMDISDLDDADPKDYGRGPPQTVIVFPSDEAEQGYLKQFKRLGLKTHDMDPDVRGGEDIYGKHLKELAEAFDQPYPLKWTKSEYGDYDALARLSDGSPLSISFEHTTPYEVVVSFTRNHSLDVTGAGDAQRVFATVLAAIQEFLKKEQPANISFSASKEDEEGGNTESRAKLYNRLVDRYATQWGYSVRVFDQGSQVEYELYRGFESPFESQEHDLVESLRQEFEQLEEEFLGEIKMSPTNLRAEAAKTGAQAGMEFEMIVPNLGSVDGSEDMEPDWDMDERVRGFGSIRNFFHNGDYNSRRDVDRLEEQLINDYYDSDWLSERKLEEWQEVAEDHIRDLVDRDYEDEFREQAREEVMDNTPEFGVNSAELSAAVEQRYEELRDAKINEILADMGREYDEAYEEWEQNEWQDMANDSDWQDEWLEDQGIRTMQDVQSNYDISWPYYTSVEEEADIDAIADDFSNAVDKPVNASRSYHGARRESGHYVVEPDGSLEGDNPSDAGLEFVSPPMPIDEMISDLNKVREWAGMRGCYTNDSTGLHINISVPDFSIEKLDYVKLALLLGDKYVLEQFGRVGNTYCKAAIGKVQDNIKRQPETAKAMLDKMRGGMEQLASKAIHSGSTDKYTSINTKSGYIEFRSPGGDWLDANFDKIENTLLRFTVALSAAMDPEAYRQEYLKKLYKLLEPTAVETKNPDTIKYFADYVAGKTPRAALRSFVKQAQLQRKIAKDPTGGQEYWWDVSRPGYFASIEVVARSKEEAIAKAIEPGNYPDWAGARNTLQAKPLRPYDSSPVKASVGEPQPAGGMRPSNPDGNYVIFSADSRAGDPPAYRFMAANNDDADTVLLQWSREHPGNWEVHYDANQRLGQPPIPGSTLDLQRQRAASTVTTHHPATDQHPTFTMTRPLGAGRELVGWQILDADTGQELHSFSGVGNSQADANRIAGQWVRQNAPDADITQVEVVPMWREA